MNRTSKPRVMFGPFEVVTINQPDEIYNPPEVDASNYTGCTAEETAKYLSQDQSRLDAYNAVEWCYLQLGIELRIQTAANWAVWTTVGRAYLGGVESDSDESYIQAELERLKDEALHDAELVYKALADVTNTLPSITPKQLIGTIHPSGPSDISMNVYQFRGGKISVHTADDVSDVYADLEDLKARLDSSWEFTAIGG